MQMLSKVEIERMYQLADVLETVPSADFDLGAWCLRQPHTAVTVTGIVIRAGCGFAGCAMGWAVHTGMFPGLKVENGCLYYRDESGLEVTGFDAAATVFGITLRVASFLFAPVQYRFHAPATDVAGRLRRFAEIVERRLARASHGQGELCARARRHCNDGDVGQPASPALAAAPRFTVAGNRISQRPVAGRGGVTAGVVGRYCGAHPRAKVSMMIMRPPQQGQGCASVCGSLACRCPRHLHHWARAAGKIARFVRYFDTSKVLELWIHHRSEPAAGRWHMSGYVRMIGNNNTVANVAACLQRRIKCQPTLALLLLGG